MIYGRDIFHFEDIVGVFGDHCVELVLDIDGEGGVSGCVEAKIEKYASLNIGVKATKG